MLKIIKQKIKLSPDLEKKIKWAENYSNINVSVENGNLIRLEPTNIAYIEPHKIKINNIEFLFFNGYDIFCINNISNKHKLCELSYYFKMAKNNEFLDF